MQKIDRAHINITLHLKFGEKTLLREIFSFNKVVSFVFAAMLEGILLPSNMVAKTTFCLYLVKHLIVMLRCAVNVTRSSFNIFLQV